MPRAARLDTPGILQHVMIRGIERRKIFRNDDDRKDMLNRLATLLPETGTVCYAWAFLDNHAHFLFRSGPRGIAVLMRRLLTGYVIGFNRRHRRCGQLFQNRYKSIICQEDAYLKQLVAYIHLNPLRARLVSELAQRDGILIGLWPEPHRFSMCRSQMCCAAGVSGPVSSPAAWPATGRCESWACRRPSWRGVLV
jgi:REP element-mobilizing transposase RayT